MAFVSNLLASIGKRIVSSTIGSSSMTSSSVFRPSQTLYAVANAWSYNSCRYDSSLYMRETKMRNNFPRPKENKRLRKMGYKARMRDPAKRQIIMRRILKNRHLLSP